VETAPRYSTLSLRAIVQLPGVATHMTLSLTDPFTNPTNAFEIMFTGLVRNQQIFSLEAGTSYLSATAPMAGAITSITGYAPTNGDTVKLWKTSTSNFVSYAYSSGSWGTNGVPMLSVGQGFVLISANARTWTNTWDTGVCGSP